MKESPGEERTGILQALGPRFWGPGLLLEQGIIFIGVFDQQLEHIREAVIDFPVDADVGDKAAAPIEQGSIGVDGEEAAEGLVVEQGQAHAQPEPFPGLFGGHSSREGGGERTGRLQVRFRQQWFF